MTEIFFLDNGSINISSGQDTIVSVIHVPRLFGISTKMIKKCFVSPLTLIFSLQTLNILESLK